MRGTAALLAAKNKIKKIYPLRGSSWGPVSSTTIKKPGNYEGGPVPKEKVDPIVAFSRPPPLPPVVGPLVALSLLETWWSHDENED